MGYPFRQTEASETLPHFRRKGNGFGLWASRVTKMSESDTVIGWCFVAVLAQRGPSRWASTAAPCGPRHLSPATGSPGAHTAPRSVRPAGRRRGGKDMEG